METNVRTWSTCLLSLNQITEMCFDLIFCISVFALLIFEVLLSAHHKMLVLNLDCIYLVSLMQGYFLVTWNQNESVISLTPFLFSEGLNQPDEPKSLNLPTLIQDSFWLKTKPDCLHYLFLHICPFLTDAEDPWCTAVWSWSWTVIMEVSGPFSRIKRASCGAKNNWWSSLTGLFEGPEWTEKGSVKVITYWVEPV